MSRQLPLPFVHRPTYDAADFITAPSNAAALAWLAPGTPWPGGRLAIWGEPGAGKTHLMHVWARRHGAALLAAADIGGLPERPDGPIALDDCAPGLRGGFDEALLHLLNAATEAGLPVLLAGRTAPARWEVGLADLRSRLRAMTAVELGPPEEGLLDALLVRLLAERQLALSPKLKKKLRDRLPRTPSALREAVGRIDRAALAAGGVNDKLVAEVLADMEEASAA